MPLQNDLLKISETKFNDLWPNAEYLEQHLLEVSGSEVLKGGKEESCWHCGAPTFWIEISFEAHLCSEVCCVAKWDEYRKSCGLVDIHLNSIHPVDALKELGVKLDADTEKEMRDICDQDVKE